MVRFLPPQPAEELAQVYRAADVVTVPSHNESFGLVALEAQACGTPVVAAAVGGLPVAVSDGVSGLLVPGHGAGQWADALSSVVRDPAYRDKLASGATGHAARFSWERTTEALHSIYEQATGETSALFRQTSERFIEIVRQMREMSAAMSREMDQTRTELRKGILELPQETADTGAGEVPG